MPRRSSLRASDADRDYVAERLRAAAGEGRLLAEELEHRLGVAFSARTYGELDALVADLPRERPVGPARQLSMRFRPASIAALVILFPLVLAVAAALMVAVMALFTAWAATVTLAALFLGPRSRAVRGTWAIGCRSLPQRYRGRRPVGGFTPWL